VTDIDFATTARPETVMERAAAIGIKYAPTGVDHGTVTLITGGRGHQVTTLREDVETDGRHAVVRFGRDWAADAQRRDFTLNALSVDAAGTLFDPVGGYADLEARRIRFIGDPDQRIAEDYLRILRFFRFYAECGAGVIDEAGLQACIRGRDGIAGLAAERINHELCRLLVAERATDAAEAMAAAGILDIVLGGQGDITGLRRVIEFEQTAGLPSSYGRRLGALAVAASDDVDRLTARLKLANADRDILRDAAQGLGDALPPSEHELRERIYRNGKLSSAARLALAAARASTPIADWAGPLAALAGWEPPSFPVAGVDAIAAGIPRGPAIGRVLRELENWWISEDFRPDRNALLRRLQQIHAAQQ
jgi:tRNA nucleotidyltransferase/poly(A) polymerase